MKNAIRPFRCENDLSEMDTLDTTLKDPLRTKKYVRTKAPEGETDATDKESDRPKRTGVDNMKRPLQLI